jgi:hypothetical protein
MPAFTSASRQEENAFYGNVLLIMTSKNGRILSDHSATPELDEVVFLSGTRFRVVAVERNGDDAVIELEEI